MTQDNKNELILRYTALAVKNKRENKSIAPTTDMEKIKKILNLTHEQIIKAAAELTKE